MRMSGQGRAAWVCFSKEGLLHWLTQALSCYRDTCISSSPPCQWEPQNFCQKTSEEWKEPEVGKCPLICPLQSLLVVSPAAATKTHARTGGRTGQQAAQGLLPQRTVGSPTASPPRCSPPPQHVTQQEDSITLHYVNLLLMSACNQFPLPPHNPFCQPWVLVPSPVFTLLGCSRSLPHRRGTCPARPPQPTATPCPAGKRPCRTPAGARAASTES